VQRVAFNLNAHLYKYIPADSQCLEERCTLFAAKVKDSLSALRQLDFVIGTKESRKDVKRVEPIDRPGEWEVEVQFTYVITEEGSSLWRMLVEWQEMVADEEIGDTKKYADCEICEGECGG